MYTHDVYSKTCLLPAKIGEELDADNMVHFDLRPGFWAAWAQASWAPTWPTHSD